MASFFLRPGALLLALTLSACVPLHSELTYKAAAKGRHCFVDTAQVQFVDNPRVPLMLMTQRRTLGLPQPGGGIMDFPEQDHWRAADALLDVRSRFRLGLAEAVRREAGAARTGSESCRLLVALERMVYDPEEFLRLELKSSVVSADGSTPVLVNRITLHTHMRRLQDVVDYFGGELVQQLKGDGVL